MALPAALINSTQSQEIIYTLICKSEEKNLDLSLPVRNIAHMHVRVCDVQHCQCLVSVYSAK